MRTELVMKTHFFPALVLSALMAPQLAQAAQPGAVEAVLVVWQVPDTANGRPVLVMAKQVKPGDVLSYQVTYINKGAKAVRQVVATLPIPAKDMVFVPGSAWPAGASASTDGRHFTRLPLKRLVVLPDGQREMRLVPPREYRALRWELGELAPGQSRQVNARMRVDAAAALVSTADEPATNVTGSAR
jgi:uncharacterized repeat protein (TIGR01451 family)